MKKVLYNWKVLVLPALLLICGPASATSVLYSQGRGYAYYDPAGSDVQTPDGVIVSDQSAGRFADNFDFFQFDSGGFVITGLQLTLEFVGAGPSCPYTLCSLGENWFVRAQGSNSSAQTDDIFSQLVDSSENTQTFLYTAATDTGGADVFAHSLATKNFSFWFSEESLGDDQFLLKAALFEILGESFVSEPDTPSSVPLPAAGFLLASAVAGLTVLRKRHRIKAGTPLGLA